MIIGNSGVEKVVELSLSEYEKKNFNLSIKAVENLIEKAKDIDPTLND